MPCRTKPGPSPSRHEFVDLVPAIEADTEAVRFQQPVYLAEGWIQPFAGAVVADGVTVARAVIAQVRRVGQAEIDRFRWQPAHDVGAVALQDGVGRHWAPPFKTFSAAVTAVVRSETSV